MAPHPIAARRAQRLRRRAGARARRAAPATSRRSGSIRSARARARAIRSRRSSQRARAAAFASRIAIGRSSTARQARAPATKASIAWLGAFGYADLEDLVDAANEAGEPALLVALDGVEDPRNLGAILRSAYLLGAHGVIIPEHRAAQVTAVVAKARPARASWCRSRRSATSCARSSSCASSACGASPCTPRTTPSRSSEIDGTMPLVLVLGAEGTRRAAAGREELRLPRADPDAAQRRSARSTCRSLRRSRSTRCVASEVEEARSELRVVGSPRCDARRDVRTGTRARAARRGSVLGGQVGDCGIRWPSRCWTIRARARRHAAASMAAPVSRR